MSKQSKMSSAQWLNQAGFTLIEVMLCVILVGLFLVGVVGANTVVQKNNRVVHERIIANQDANQIIEQMRNTAMTGAFPANVTNAFPDATVVGNFNNLTNQQIVVDYADPSADPLNVTVTVSWLDDNARPAAFTLNTLMTQRET